MFVSCGVVVVGVAWIQVGFEDSGCRCSQHAGMFVSCCVVVVVVVGVARI
jgi:hypothetical protein